MRPDSCAVTNFIKRSLSWSRMEEFPKPNILAGQPCPFCDNSTLSLTESERDIPFFGKVFLFSMTCTSCKYHKADVECVDQKEPCRYTFEVSTVEDMSVRVVKSATATVKIPFMMTIESGEAANGYVTNIEGLLNRVKRAIEIARDDAEDDGDKTKAKNMLKKLLKVVHGQETLKIIIEDPTGNSAIISDKAKKVAL